MPLEMIGPRELLVADRALSLGRTGEHIRLYVLSVRSSRHTFLMWQAINFLTEYPENCSRTAVDDVAVHQYYGDSAGWGTRAVMVRARCLI